MTLDEMIQQCADDVDETPLSKDSSTGVYLADAAIIANKFVTGINFAYRKIAREKLELTHNESIALDANKLFSTAALSRKLITIHKIETAADSPVEWERRPGFQIYVPAADANASVIVTYRYLPAKLVHTQAGLLLSPELPEGQVDHRILCYYGDFEFLSKETDVASRNRSQTWLALFNSGYQDIKSEIGELLNWGIE